jgi:hypothetical protein
VVFGIVNQFATASGMMAAAIAVCGFVAHAGPALSGASEKQIRDATVVGGLVGLFLSSLVVVLSAIG